MSAAKNDLRKQIFANNMQRDIFWLVFLASLVPALIATICLYFLIFNVTANQCSIPETIAYNIIPAAQKVTVILLFAIPISVIVILIFARKMTHKIVGPFNRVVRELEETVEGKRKSHIAIRKDDKFWPLVCLINKLIDKIK
jgi:ABC-type multidrug transport system fused ATPase/permease subunit